MTSLKVGMADPIWPTSPWYLAFISWKEPSAGYLIEHSHRALGYFVGCVFIVLTFGLLASPRLRWLGWVCLPAIILQGLLGGFRVRLNALVGTDLAFVHGWFAQIVLGLSVIAAVASRKAWPTPYTDLDQSRRQQLGAVSIWVVALVFAQTILGGLIRHMNSTVGQRLHVINAFLVVLAAALFIQKGYALSTNDRVLRRALIALGCLVSLQVLLGIEAWMSRVGSGLLPELQPITISQAVIRTAHYLVGSAVFVAAVTASLEVNRPTLLAVASPVVDLRGLEASA